MNFKNCQIIVKERYLRHKIFLQNLPHSYEKRVSSEKNEVQRSQIEATVHLKPYDNRLVLIKKKKKIHVQTMKIGLRIFSNL